MLIWFYTYKLLILQVHRIYSKLSKVTNNCISCFSDPWSAELYRTGSHQTFWGNQSRVLGCVCKVRWEWSIDASCFLWSSSVSSLNCLFCSGDGVRDFFLRVASLTFEANILAEIEKSGSRQVKDIVSESFSHTFRYICIFWNVLMALIPGAHTRQGVSMRPATGM